MNFMSKTLPIFFEILTSLQNRCYIATESLGEPRECIQDITSTVEDFCGIPDLKTRNALF